MNRERQSLGEERARPVRPRKKVSVAGSKFLPPDDLVESEHTAADPKGGAPERQRLSDSLGQNRSGNPLEG